MKKRSILTCIFLSICLIFTGVGVNHAHGTVLGATQNIIFDEYEDIEPHGGLVSVQLDRHNATTLFFRVSHASISGFNTSMSTTIVPQRLENGRWVNRGATITRTVYNALRLDESGTINVSAYGAGAYRIRVTVTNVNSGITSTIGPVYSFTVNL